MKNILILTVLLTGMAIGCQTKQNISAIDSQLVASTAIVEVYDFHTTSRCMTCMAIEENTRNTISEYFADQLNKGSILLKVVNVDKPENAALADHFQAFGTSLFLRVNKDNQSQIINLSEFAFMNARNAEEFKTQLKNRIETYL